MKISLFGILLFCSSLVSCQDKENDNYLFFLHNRFLENYELHEKHPEYGRTEYIAILSKFEESDFTVISEKRAPNTNARTYALYVVSQIDSLIAIGVKPNKISIVGTSKGGYIAQYVSTLAENADLNFVFIASFREQDIINLPEINYCGNILTIYEKTDPFGVSALSRIKTSTCTINYFKEIELNTKMKHGFLFKPLDAWMQPTIEWAKENYTKKTK